MSSFGNEIEQNPERKRQDNSYNHQYSKKSSQINPFSHIEPPGVLLPKEYNVGRTKKLFFFQINS